MARIVIAGQRHHVVQRGNNRQDVFFVDNYRRAVLEFLREHGQRLGINAAGYCLMTHPIHLVKTPLWRIRW